MVIRVTLPDGRKVGVFMRGLATAFIDPDLFLCFLHMWIFQDWSLIDYATDPDLNCGDPAYLLSERLQRRFNTLATTDLSKEAAALEQETDSPDPDNATLFGAMHRRPKAVLSGEFPRVWQSITL